ncbi:MFS transporter [Desulfosporosinus fructosivorans]|uniref:MFS transporter n=1 Tax=Desulfosporosinus fructosivorans TaxID=2018669 RepID=A0A4Z0RCB6_9FIRM|nr:MFS transporter [Desulfosporosinus fructosivorans]TGE39266.1 MFS transporter [Desulfosporosinus fructosivorans]
MSANLKTQAPQKKVVGVDLVQKPTRQRVLLGFVLLVTLLVAYVDRVNVSVLLADPIFLEEMGITGKTVKMGLIMTVFLLTYGLSNFMFGPVCDAIGPRKAMMIAIMLWAISMLIGGLVGTFTLMLAARLILGLGEGLHYPNQGIFVKNWFPPKERGKANAAWQSGVLIGPIFAMPLFAWIITIWGWRETFYILAVLGLIPLLLLWRLVTDTPRENKRINKAELDYIENALKIESEGQVYVKAESLGQRLKSFVKNYRYWVVVCHYTCFCCIWWGMMTWLPSYLKLARGFSWSDMGMLSALPYILSLITLWGCGQLSDKIGRRAPFMAVGFLIAGVSIYFGAYVNDNMTSAILISVGIAGIAITLSGAHSILQSIVSGNTIGTATGVMNGISNFISALSPLVMGYIIALTGGYAGGLMFLVVAAVIGSICMIILTVQKY